MDAADMTPQQPLRFPATTSAAASRTSSAVVGLKRKRVRNGALSCGFSDRGHLQYYYKCSSCSSAAAVKELKTEKEKSLEKTKKKQMKLLERMTEDLTFLSESGCRMGPNGSLTIAEAAELFVEQLQKAKAEKKEEKRSKREQKARFKAAARMHMGHSSYFDTWSSSSSSSESSETSSTSSSSSESSETSSTSSSSSECSDSECGEVVDMSSFELATALKEKAITSE